MKVGRPSTYKPVYCEWVVALGAEGKSQVQISAAIDVPRTTMLSWADVHPEFSTALTRAKELEQAWWEDQAQKNLATREFNAALWAKSVASRFRSEYGDKVTQEITGKNGGAIETKDVTDLTPVERAQRLAAILAAGGLGAGGRATDGGQGGDAVEADDRPGGHEPSDAPETGAR